MMNTNDIIEEILKQIKQPLWENWHIKQKIGSGAFSAVYKVEAQRSANRTMVSALKIEPITADGTHFFDEERKRKYIENKKRSAETEAEIMYSLRRCPYIVSYEEEDTKELYINGVFEGYYYLIRMEYLTAIATLIQTKQFDFSEKNIIELATNIGKGIQAAHRLGIIHRDIKLDNFFVDDWGTYKLGDFNISKKTGAARTFAGTPGYLAPEIYRAKSNIDEVYTSQADIYSFGICLYQLANELLFPFEDEMNLEDAIDKRMSGVELPPPKKVSPEFGDIILKACEFSTEKRYKTVDDMLDDIADIPVKRATAKAAKPEPAKNKAAAEPKGGNSSAANVDKGFEVNFQLQNEIENLSPETMPAILNEDIRRNEEVESMQYDLKSNGEFVEFGSYHVAVNNPKMPLRWRILAIEEDKALIITFMGIDVRNFNDTKGVSNWEKSSMRKWLNTEFYNEAFTESEKHLIVESELMNYKNVTYRTDNGGKTKDNVFLLSIEEVERYFPTSNERIVKPTAYARNKGVFIAPNGNVWWWLRSSGNTEEYAADVDYGGDVDKYGSERFYGVNCVRPAVWISLAFLNENRRKSFKESFKQSHNSSFNSQNNSAANQLPGTIKFGRYFYNDGYSKEPLEWQVLKTENDRALIITANGIDCMPYNDNPTFTTWENSQMRKWLNNDFISAAFNEKEQNFFSAATFNNKEKEFIKEVTFNNPDNPFFNTKGGRTSTDKVFLLSISEVTEYLKSNEDRMIKATPFAKSKGLFVAENGCSWWWLRSPGNVQNYAADVDYGGDVDFYGSSAIVGMNAVRPAMWVDIEVLRKIDFVQKHTVI